MTLLGILLLFFGLHGLWHAFQILFYKRPSFIFPIKLNIWLARKFQSEEFTQEYIRKLSSPRRLFWMGIENLIAGLFLLFGSFLYLFT
jgi:hypothetical protein